MEAQATYAFEAARKQLFRKKGVIEFFGLDYVIDSDFNTYLIEINKDPQFSKKEILHVNLSYPLFHSYIDTALMF